ncbi:MAG: hypothetical protein EOO01_28975 [Chitinophagaceae bacterium]|nr:MAG: hypothetical protein EOO01_28975 [Chitinophagaceae bacterium]
MSLDIQLSPFIAKQLYGNNLYDFNTSQPAATQTHLGGYLKKILILTADKNHPVIADSDLDFLGKILLPCGLGMADVALVNTMADSVNSPALITHFSPEKVILFGVEQSKLSLPLQFPHYQAQPFDNCTFLAAPALTDLQNDAVGKKDLWAALRKLFSLN